MRDSLSKLSKNGKKKKMPRKFAKKRSPLKLTSFGAEIFTTSDSVVQNLCVNMVKFHFCHQFCAMRVVEIYRRS